MAQIIDETVWIKGNQFIAVKQAEDDTCAHIDIGIAADELGASINIWGADPEDLKLYADAFLSLYYSCKDRMEK